MARPRRAVGRGLEEMYSRWTRRSVAATSRRRCLVTIHHCSNQVGVTFVRWLVVIDSARETEAGPIFPESFATWASRLGNAWCKRR